MSLKVLFLDDEPMLCEIFSDFFSSPDIEIITFTDPKSALEYSSKNNLDIIVVDYRMPGTSGDQIAAQMPAEIPKYLLTGELEPDPKFKFTGILNKPFDAKLIQSILNGVLKKKQAAEKKSA